MDATPTTEQGFKKLTVAQLKALCKQKKITGYSKVAKPALIQKLLEHAGRTSAPSATPTAITVPTQEKRSSDTSLTFSNDCYPPQSPLSGRNSSASTSDPSSRLLTPPPSQHIASFPPDSILQPIKISNAANTARESLSNAHTPTLVPAIQRPALKSSDASVVVSEQSLQTALTQAPQNINTSGALTSVSFPEKLPNTSKEPHSVSTLTPHALRTSPRRAATSKHVLAPISDPKSYGDAKTSSKRRSPTLDTNSVVLTKKTKFSLTPKSSSSCKAGASDRPSRGAFKVPEVPLLWKNAPVPVTHAVPDRTVDMRIPTTDGRKRFTPLTVQKKASLNVNAVQVSENTSMPQSPSISSNDGGNLNPTHSLYYLDFPATPPLVLSRITLPPLLSQRKHVARFAIILSQVAKEDLSQCILVSRMFRYAIYLSATTCLRRDFPGRRLETLLQHLPPNMTNLWPYLLQREREAQERLRIFNDSFLGRVLTKDIIAARIWTSPDEDKQIEIAVRFILTRLFFSISIGGEKSGIGWLQGRIIDVQEIVKGEIWWVLMEQPSSSLSRSSLEPVYVLEATCEVIGPAPPSMRPSSSSPKLCPLRADWSTYIADRASHIDDTTAQTRSQRHVLPLMNRLGWTNHEEYEKGISKLWLKRIDGEGDVGRFKRTLAEKYILACVVENSVSGRWMSSTQMAQDFSGLPTTIHAVSTSRIPATNVHLFLPAHHHVESVHLTTVIGLPLHPALAVVQTPGREYFVLRDNGMQVGCEEDDISSTWMSIIGCTERGETKRV